MKGETGTRFRINGQEEDNRDNVEGLALEAVEQLLGAGLESIETEFKITQINKLFGLKSDEVHQLMRQKVIVARRGSSVFVSTVDAVMVYIAKKDEAVIESAKDRKKVRRQVAELLEAFFEQ